MKKGSIILIVVAVIILLLAISCISSYNSLVDLKEQVTSKEAEIDVQLQRRADLIPNLVNTVKGYMKHEQSVIDSVTSARENLLGAKTIEAKSKANTELTNALNALFVIVENYPDLKASENFTQLQDELAGTENRIAYARKNYNEAVETYNKTIKKFPTVVIASMFGFKEQGYFESQDAAKEVPNVDFQS